MKKTTIFSVLAFAVIGLLISTSIVSAYRGDYSAQGPNFSEDRHELMEQAFDTLDYDAWYDLMTENGRHPRVVDMVTEDNFVTFVEAHDAAMSGDFETADALRKDLGLNNGIGPKDGSSFGAKNSGQGSGRRQHRI